MSSYEQRDGGGGKLPGGFRWSPLLVAGLALGALLALTVGVGLGLLWLRDDEVPDVTSAPEAQDGGKFTAPDTPGAAVATRPNPKSGGTEATAPAATATPSPAATWTPFLTPTPDREAMETALLRQLNYRSANGEVVFADRAAAPGTAAPQIDGELNEWDSLPYGVPYDFTSENVAGLSGNRAGPADLDGRFAFAWDEGYLFLAIEVTDDVHVQSLPGRELYKGDDVEIQFDADLQRDFNDSALSSDDGQIGFSAGDFGSLGAEAYVWRLNGGEASSAGIVVASRRTGTVTTLEARIPWQALGLSGPTLEYPFGLALCLSDNDSPGTAQQQSVICTAPGREWGEPTTWGTLVLVDWR